MKLILPLLGIVVWSAALDAQENHFDGVKWKERETDHFFIRADGTGYDPASRYAEKVWDVCVEVLPKLKDDFENNEFRTPSGAKGAEEAPCRFCVYLTDAGADFQHLVQIDAGRNGWDDNTVKLTHRVGNYADPQARYTVFCKGNPEESAGGDRDVTPVFVHSTGSTLLRGRAGSASPPFWIRAGFGYYVEHMLFDLCRVHYLDFEAYYQAQDAEIRKGETLGPDRDWPSVLRKMCKDDDRCSLDNVLGAQILTLSPKQSGYIFALVYFLVHDDASKEKFQKLVAKMRDGSELTRELLLETYGYADNAELETAWYEWMESRAFK